MILEDACVVGRRLGRGRGVDFAADILDFLGDLAGGAPAGALESHVLKQMGDAMFAHGFVA
ncbi:hypothetical protein D3C80_2213460 [compost metagenome]